MINITLTNKEKTYEISDMDFITTVAITTDVYVQLAEEAQLESQVPDFAFSIRDSYPKFLNTLEQTREELEADGKELEENAFIRFWFEQLIFEEFKLHDKTDAKGKPLKPFYKTKDYIL